MSEPTQPVHVAQLGERQIIAATQPEEAEPTGEREEGQRVDGRVDQSQFPQSRQPRQQLGQMDRSQIVTVIEPQLFDVGAALQSGDQRGDEVSAPQRFVVQIDICEIRQAAKPASRSRGSTRFR